MLSNAYFLAKFRFDTAENEPAKNLQNFEKCIFPQTFRFATNRPRSGPGGGSAKPGFATRPAASATGAMGDTVDGEIDAALDALVPQEVG